MSLSVRNEIVIKINDKMNVVTNLEWPEALPVEMNRIVISYLLNALNILEEVEILDKQFDNETMQPFVKAVNKIKPWLGNSIFTKIRNINKTEYECKGLREYNYYSNTIFDQCIEKIHNFPIETQINFLLDIYNQNWETKEKNDVLYLTKREIQEIYKDTASFQNGHYHNIDDLKQHILQSIHMKIAIYICNIYQTSKVNFIKNERSASNTNHTKYINKMFHHESNLLNNRKLWGSRLLALGIFLNIVSIFFIRKPNLFKGLQVFSIILMVGSKLFEANEEKPESNTLFLSAVRDRITRVHMENKINGQETIDDSKEDTIFWLASDPEDRRNNNDEWFRFRRS